MRLDPNSHRSVDPKRFHISANGGGRVLGFGFRLWGLGCRVQGGKGSRIRVSKGVI